jgi:SAM-dependent methyltransferase
VTASPYVRLNQKAGNAGYYDAVLYRRGGYDDHVGAMERRVIERLASNLAAAGPIRSMDFACGTGRILRVLEPFSTESYGVDTSREMLQSAALRCPNSQLVLGDVLARGKLPGAPFDVVTAFRFFLNTEKQLRLPTLRALAALLRGSNSRLVFNIHANSRSSIALTQLYRRRKEIEPLSAMSPAETRAIIAAAGLEVVERYGFGLFPQRLYRGRAGGAVKWLDAVAASTRLLAPVSHDLVYVCRLRKDRAEEPQPERRAGN